MKNITWIKLFDQTPKKEDVGEKVLLFRIMNEIQKSTQKTIHDTDMVKHCDPNETWWLPLPNDPI